jgi:TonB family protein
MRILYPFLLLALLPTRALCQEPQPDGPPYDIAAVQEQPVFPGGQEGLYKWIAAHVHYPDSALAKNVKGKVYVSFVVGSDGRVGQVKLRRGVDRWLDEEAVRVIRAMPAWAPARMDGKPVPVEFTMPLNFTF